MTKPFVRFLSGLMVGAVIACSAFRAEAEMLTYQFQGTLTQVVSDSFGFADGWGAVGNTFSGTFFFDPGWQNSAGGVVNGSTETYYYHESGDPAEAIIGMSLTTPLQQRTIPGASGLTLAKITDGLVADEFVLSGEYANGFYMGLTLVDPTGTAVLDTSLPVYFDLAGWEGDHYVEISGLPDGGYVLGTITSMQVVPEPGVPALMGLGILLWSCRRRFFPN